MDKKLLEELNRLLQSSPEGFAVLDSGEGEKIALVDYHRYQTMQQGGEIEKKLKKILVTGGAGYVGSHTVRRLQQAGYEVVVYDNLSTGRKDTLLGCRLIVGDLGDEAMLNRVFGEETFDAVIHFAASIEVEESVKNPAKYFKNNLACGLNLLQAMARTGVGKLIFSSTAAVYGQPEKNPILENAAKRPVNPYGESKLLFERVLSWYYEAYGIRSVALRYFNASGAWPEEKLGYRNEGFSHLIPKIMDVAAGRADEILVFGQDYPTPDGTGIRDYVHVLDLAEAHLLALQALNQAEGAVFYNVGTGKGSSVKEVIDTAMEITSRMIPMNVVGRRTGDPASLVADSGAFQKDFGWQAKHDLTSILESSWQWHKTF